MPHPDNNWPLLFCGCLSFLGFLIYGGFLFPGIIGAKNAIKDELEAQEIEKKYK